MIAAYLRVSSRSQSLTTQRDAIERMAKARGDVIACWYHEKQSGAKLERPVLSNLRDLARTGDLQRLYVFRLDRLTRSGIRDTLGVLEEFRDRGCEVRTVADGFDLAGPGSEIVIAVVSWAAQMERLALGERIAAARTRVERSGKKWGRPSRLTPYEARRLEAEHKKGRSIRELAAAFKCPRSTVAQAVSGKGAYKPLVSPLVRRRVKKN